MSTDQLDYQTFEEWRAARVPVIRVKYYFYDEMHYADPGHYRVSIPAGHEDFPLVSEEGECHRVVKNGEELSLDDLLFDLKGQYPDLSLAWEFDLIERGK